MQLLIDGTGQVTCLYEEVIDLSAFGHLRIRRASHVEPDTHGCWWADLAPVNGPRLGPFAWRSAALDAERAWLEAHGLKRKAKGKDGHAGIGAVRVRVISLGRSPSGPIPTWPSFPSPFSSRATFGVAQAQRSGKQSFRYNVLANTFEVPLENNLWPPIFLFTALSK